MADTTTLSLADEIKSLKEDQAKLLKSLSEPVRRKDIAALFGGQAPGYSREVGERGYSFIKAIAYAKGWDTDASHCAVELDTNQKLKSVMETDTVFRHPQSLAVPFSMRHMPMPKNTAEEKIFAETSHRIKAYQDQLLDVEEMRWVNKRLGGQFNKALGTLDDSAGGTLVSFPLLGELIDIQRNMEVFANAGASEVPLPRNGRMQYPKLTNGATAYWVGEATQITSSQEATGYLDLQAKKLGIFVKMNNELLRFASPMTEGMVRLDMARVAALAIDLSMLQGTGGTQIEGIIGYPSASSWSFGNDKLLTYTVGANLFQPEDAANMEALLPDTADEFTAWVMNRKLWSKIRNRRNDAVTANDGKGAFTFFPLRDAAAGVPLEFEGVKVVRSSQVSSTRGTGSQTYVLAGNFRDWLIGRYGVMEILLNGLGDTPYQNDQTWIRGIQHIDAGARHASSFVFADAINVA
jgi:HK97 family phage major capsid protein